MFEKNAEISEGKKRIPLNEMLTPKFIIEYTCFTKAEELFAASGFKIDSEDDVAAIPNDKWNGFIRSISTFSDWEAMLEEATKEWIIKNLELE